MPSILGIIVSPTAIISGTPLFCTMCSTETGCKGKFNASDTDVLDYVSDKDKPSIDFNAWWVKEYCTKHAMDKFILYFPYILLIMATIIVMVERAFQKYDISFINWNLWPALAFRSNEQILTRKQIARCIKTQIKLATNVQKVEISNKWAANEKKVKVSHKISTTVYSNNQCSFLITL